RQLYIVGDIGGVDSTQPATLIAFPVGASGTQSYTWSPGSIHTASITVSPTVTPTYTLNYSDALGTMSVTTTLLRLPPVSCQLVPNGGFEATSSNPLNSFSNIDLAYCGGTITSAPLSWISPTCGTPDYFNSIFNTPNN